MRRPFVRPSCVSEKYLLTVIAFRLLGQFRLVNVVLPFRHIGCTRISHRYDRYRGNAHVRGNRNARTKRYLAWHDRPKYDHTNHTAAPRDVVQPLASSLTKMAAPANNRKQFPVSRAAALRMNSARHVYYYARDVIAAVGCARAQDPRFEHPLSLSLSLFRRRFANEYIGFSRRSKSI